MNTTVFSSTRLAGDEAALPSVTMGKVVLWTLLFQLAWHFKAIPLLLSEGTLPDGDDFLRLHQVRNFLEGAGWFDVSVPRMAPPLGGDMHWSRLPDVPIAGFISAFAPLTGIALAERLTAILWPMLLLVMTTVLLVRTTEKLFPSANRLVTLLFTVTCVTALVEFAPGRIDHHNVQILLFSLTLFGLANSDRDWGHMTVGIAFALSIAIGLDLLVMLLLVIAWIGFEWVIGLDRDGSGLKRVGIGLAAASIIVYPISVPRSAWSVPVCDAISSVYLSMELLIAAGLLLISGTSHAIQYPSFRRTALMRMIFGGLTGVAVAAIFVSFFPQCIAGPLSGISAELKAEWLSKVVEAQSLASFAALKGPAAYATPAYVFTVLIATLLVWQRRDVSGRLIAIWASLAICFVLGFIQVRAFRVGIFASVPLCVLIVHSIWEAISLRLPGKRSLAMAITAAAGVLFLSPVWMLAAEAAFPRPDKHSAAPDEAGRLPATAVTDESNATYETCNRASQFAFLADLPSGLTLNDINSGPAILVNTSHRIVAGNYHRNERAILDTQRFFAADENKARQIASRLQPKYVVLCAPDPAGQSAKAETSIQALILAGNPPSWLKRVSPTQDRLIVLQYSGG